MGRPLVDTDVLYIELLAPRILTAMDFQDALIANIAEEHHVEAIVTRNTRHFGKVPMPVLTPEEWLNTDAK